MNDHPIYFAKQLAIRGMRLTLKVGLSELSHSDHFLQRDDAARRHNPILTAAVEKGVYAI